jgi:hypothetical protein
MQKGSCLCGAVSFEVAAELQPAVACHCRQCRKQTDHYFASADVPRSALTLSGTDRLSWFQSSARVRRGFCSACGSTLFWDPTHKDTIAVARGAFDTPTATRLKTHIFVDYKGDYYDIADGLPQHGQ